MRAPLLAALAVLLSASTAQAELVFLTSSPRPLAVKAYRMDGDSIVLSLRAGGEIVCDRNLVERIEPDEVPYPEEATASTAPSPVVQAVSSDRYGDIVQAVATAE